MGTDFDSSSPNRVAGTISPPFWRDIEARIVNHFLRYRSINVRYIDRNRTGKSHERCNETTQFTGEGSELFLKELATMAEITPAHPANFHRMSIVAYVGRRCRNPSNSSELEIPTRECRTQPPLFLLFASFERLRASSFNRSQHQIPCQPAAKRAE